MLNFIKKNQILPNVISMTERCKEIEKYAQSKGLLILDSKDFWGE